ncbi:MULTISPECIES: hypothetical protein [Rhodococcus]|uniref:Lipoprotein n=1 Tax=Rhodococcus oxybenzonivorans TaxID=1990687 RepID=A0AAE4UUJ0_9NOCA|nr:MULTISPECIES: hypothetical protein [Rhodococcus]MDV7244250.1 hypothetical protein [Rhodococcus oxybenzonivorans]MDV7262969.1 hypothetical protein [Rhodococcus oxybenzonivorans]MDV7274508.1 hypothetical protein [Rhodococcus oxybenzonivorans]MDV7335821.1 hypothetical protein [Rhodococcus oxybenzonivorans]MDV7345458.1 hypothetical protein [Rhodococcus oxybenzonivorans]
MFMRVRRASQTGHRRRPAALAAGAVALAAALTGCAGQGTAPAPQSAVPTSSRAVEPGVAAVPGGVTEAQAAQLCRDLEGQLQSWRTYTPTIGKTGLNGLVGTWIAQNNLNALDFLQDRGRIDVITTAACPDIRQEAVTALEIPDLASGLIGF